MLVKRFVLLFALQFFSIDGWAEADGPDYWMVTGIPKGGHLNLRLGPSVMFSVIGTVPADFKHLVNKACYPEFTTNEWLRFNSYEKQLALEMRWCKVEYKGRLGWVYAKYLTEGLPPGMND